MVSQVLPSTDAPSTRPAGLAAGFALPSWAISVLIHAGLLGVLATLTWTVTRLEPDREFAVGIVVKKDTPDGAVFESKDESYVVRDDRASEKFISETTPEAITQSLPKLPEIDPASLGISDAMLRGVGDMLAVPDAGGVTGGMVNVGFFNAQAWGSKFVFVIDRSGSMQERDALGAAKRELHAALAKLPPEVQFQIILYNLNQQAIPVGGPTHRMLPATEPNKLRARRFMEPIVPEGSTSHVPPLKLAIGLGPDVIFFLTDADNLRAQDVKEVTELNRDRVKIHAIEFGPGPEIERPSTLRDLANSNGGTYRYVDTTRLGR